MRTSLMVLLVAVCTLMLFAGKVNAAQTNYTHVVVKGESLRKIAEAHYGKGKVGRKLMKRIAWVNRIKNPDKIFPGQLIKFPQFSTPKKTAGKKVDEIKQPAEEQMPEPIEIIHAAKAVEQPVAPIEIIYAPKPQLKELAKAKDEISADLQPQEISNGKSLNLDGHQDKKIQGALLKTIKPDIDESKKDDKSLLKVNGEIGYVFGCLDYFGVCQTFKFHLDVDKNSKGVNRFGGFVGAEVTIASLTDKDSNLKKMRYTFFGGVDYKRETENSLLSLKNGVGYQYTKNDISGLGGLDLSGLGVDLSGMGVDFSKFNIEFKDEQSTVFYLSKMDYSIKTENYRAHFGGELRLQLATKFTSDVPGNKKPDQSLVFLELGVQKKVGDDTYVGLEFKPFYFSWETNNSGAGAAASLRWRNIIVEVGAQMPIYGVDDVAKENDGTPLKMLTGHGRLSLLF